MEINLKRTKGSLELKMQYLGLPLAIIVFMLIYSMDTPVGLSYAGKMSMAVFASALILWISEAIPNYVTSLLVIVALPLTGAWGEESAMEVLGYEVIWLTMSAFIIASGMEKSGLAKRLALFLITKFGKGTNSIMALLIITNFLIAFFVPSTTARAAMMFPIVLMIINIFKETIDDPKGNFGRVLSIQGLQSNNLSTAAIVTATSSQILAISLIRDMTGEDISWIDWFVASAPVTIFTLISLFFIGKTLYPVKGVRAGSNALDSLKEESRKLGKISSDEKKALVIFFITVGLWVLDEFQASLFGFQLSLVMVAILSAALFLMPKVGILKWKEAKISWNLLIFACGAYAAGVSLDDTGVASWGLNKIFDTIGVENLSFMALFAVVTFISSFSHFIFTSKTVRTIILIPTVIGIAEVTGYDPISLALPAALCIADTITLPPHSKVNLIYYNMGFFNVSDQLIYGILSLLAKWVLMQIAALTWFSFIGII